MSTTSRRHWLPVAFLLLVATLLVAACGGDDDSGGSASGTPTSASAAPTSTGGASATTPAEPAFEPITIKLLNPGNAGIFAYAKKTGILDDRLAEVGATLEWVDGPGAFSANLDAMKAGKLTAANAAVSPVIGALIAGLDFRIFAIAEPSEARSSGIVAGKGTGITKVEDLVGKKVAVNPAAHGEYILLKALEEAGVPFDQVTRVPIQPPDAAAALASGAVDAWATFNQFFLGAIANGATPITYESDLDSDDVGIISASREQLEANPKAFEIILDTYNELVEEGHAEPAKFQNVFETTGPTAASGAVLEQQIADTKITPLSHLASPEGIARVQGVLDIFAEAGVLQRTVPVDDVVFDVPAALGVS